MKLIAWNCHQSFRTKAEKVLLKQPDVLVLPECEMPDRIQAKGIEFSDSHWVGDHKHKGLGIFTFNGWKIEALEEVSPRIPYVIPCFAVTCTPVLRPPALPDQRAVGTLIPVANL